MNVLLIRPKPHKDTIGLQKVMICEPLELEYLASNAEASGHQVQIIDMIIEHRKIKYFIQKYRPDVVGLTGYIAHVNVIKDYARQIKTANPDIKIIVGGVHAEVNPEDFVSVNIDYIIRANGIRTFLDILEGIASAQTTTSAPNEPASFTPTGPTPTAPAGQTTLSPVGQTLRNLCIYRSGAAVPEKETQFSYLYPDRSKVDRYRSHYYYMFHRNCSLIKTSFGCPYSCKFCFCRKITDGKYFYRDMEDIIGELKSIPEKEIYIVDDDFLFNAERMHEFCVRIKEEKIEKKYLVYGRADFIAGNDTVMKELKEAGLRAVIVGLESCDGKQLNKYNKLTAVSTNEAAVAVLHKYDIECYGTFITGLDWDKKDFQALGRWIKKLGLVFVNLQPLTPLRGTELYEQYKERFLIPETEFEKWDLAHLVVKPSAISARRYYWYTMLLYYKITANPKSAWYMIKKYGIHDTLKLSFGAAGVNAQYLKKLIYGK